MASYTWNGSTDEWGIASDWGGTLPTTADAVFVTGPGTFTITVSGADTVSAQDVVIDDGGATITVQAGTNFTAYGGVFLDAGTLNFDAAGAIFGSSASDPLAGEIVVGNGNITGDMNQVQGGGGYIIVGLDSSSNYLPIYFTAVGTGIIEASVGTTSILEVGAIAAAGTSYLDENQVSQTAGGGRLQVDVGATLQFDSNVGAGTTVNFNGANAVVSNAQVMNYLGDRPSLTTNITLNNMDVGVSGGTQSDAVEVLGDTVASASVTTIDGVTTLTINTTSNGTETFTLTGGDYTGDTAFVANTTVTDTQGNTEPAGFVYLDAVCFGAGTRIYTADGSCPVELLQAGDLVAVCHGGEIGFQPVKWVGVRTLDLAKHPRRHHIAPVRVARGAIGENLPVNDLVVSPDHCLFFDGKLIPAKLLVNGMTIRQDLEARSITYYHVEMERHSILLAEGVAAESYLDTGNRAFFSNAGLALILHPEFHVNAGLRCWETDACAPLAVSPAAVQPIWRPLADRAVALGYVPPTHATTTEADIHLVADGRRIDTISIKRNVYSFMVPAGVKSLSLASRSVMPNVLIQYLDDPREIGVAVRRITIRGMAGREEFSADHPALAHGWHAPERAGGALWRWTKGRAALPVGVIDGPVVVDVLVSETTTYLIDDMATEGRLAA